MLDLINRVAAAAGIDTTQAENAVGIVLSFLGKELSPETMASLSAAIPGASEAAGKAGGVVPTGILGGGGVAALGGQLMGAGLGMGEMQALGRELFAHTAEKGGPELVGKIVNEIPGLSQFV